MVSAPVSRQETTKGDESKEEENIVIEGEENRAQRELRYVYQRRRKENRHMTSVPLCAKFLSPTISNSRDTYTIHYELR
jgi:hypothetical protein